MPIVENLAIANNLFNQRNLEIYSIKTEMILKSGRLSTNAHISFTIGNDIMRSSKCVKIWMLLQGRIQDFHWVGLQVLGAPFWPLKGRL